MHGVGIGRRMDRDRPDPHFMAGAMDAQRDLAPICDQTFSNIDLVSCPRNSSPNFWDKQATQIKI
jgi:hypothetical protein